jgi:hypothetical protein
MGIAGLLSLAACGGGGDGGTPTTPPSTAATRIASTGSITVLEPQPGSTVEGPDVTVRVALEGARLVKVVSTDIKPDEGHMHIKLDGTTITLLAGLEETVPNVQPGTHVLEVEFVAADHGPFNPRVLQTVTFTVT